MSAFPSQEGVVIYLTKSSLRMQQPCKVSNDESFSICSWVMGVRGNKISDLLYMHIWVMYCILQLLKSDTCFFGKACMFIYFMICIISWSLLLTANILTSRTGFWALCSISLLEFEKYLMSLLAETKLHVIPATKIEILHKYLTIFIAYRSLFKSS